MISILRSLLAVMAFAAAWGAVASPDQPIPVREAGNILAAKSGSVQVYDYTRREPVFIFDFPTLAEQGRTFNRIVALIERMAFNDRRVLNDDDLAAFVKASCKTEETFAYGNDFLVSELVVFFNLAEHHGIPLNEEERRLRDFLVAHGLMRERFGFWQAARPNGVILSIPQTSPGSEGPKIDEAMRQTILIHELAHAEYYTVPLYRAWCRKFWREVLSEPEREKFRTFLARSGYDRTNEELMINETQAYLSFTPDVRAFNAEAAGLTEAELATLREIFRAGAPTWPLTRR